MFHRNKKILGLKIDFCTFRGKQKMNNQKIHYPGKNYLGKYKQTNNTTRL